MRGSGHPLELGELIDLELRFAADRDAPRQALRERDEGIGRTLLADGEKLSRHELFRRWLAALRAGDRATVGERVDGLYRRIGLAFAVVSLLTGAGTARAVLSYDGTHPVNIIHFLAVFAVAQLALLGVSLAAMVPAVRSATWHAYAPVHELVRQLVYRRSAGTRLEPLLGKAGALASVYGAAERWRLIVLTQRTAFFFNVGALVTCLYLIAFTDLAFAWSTTLDVDAGTMTALLRAIAWPWRWLASAVPTPELVAASRYFRMSGEYDAGALKDWWAFLLAALAAYGLVPRLVLWQLAAWRSRSLRRGQRLDHGDCQVAYERLTRCQHGWCGTGDRAPSDAAAPLPSVPAAAATDAGATECTVVIWADVPLSEDEAKRLVAQRFGWRAVAVHACGGRENGGAPRVALAEIARGDDPVVVIAEAWEAPSRAITRFLGELRGAGARRRSVVVALLGARGGAWSAPEPDDYEVWQRGAASLGDPYLRVEPMIGE